MNSKHYIDNKTFIEKLKLFRENRENNIFDKDVEDYIGNAFLDIAKGVACMHNFKNYPFLKDMISDGALNCFLYMDNYDSLKSKNPFSYFTQIVFYSFVRYIEKEKRHLYIKYKMIRDTNNFLDFSSVQKNDETNYNMSDNSFVDGYNLTIDTFIDNYENKLKTKKEKNKKTKNL